jgi:RNA recognition motif-containing protein
MSSDAPSSSSSSSSSMAEGGGDLKPSQTLYVNNLNDKVKKAALKKGLYAAFSPHGAVVDIVAMRLRDMRGQAWVAFADVAQATAAMRALQGFPFYDKPMRIAFAREKSHAIARLDGSFRPVPPEEKAKERERKKRRREEEAEGGAGAGAPASKAGRGAAGARAAPAASAPSSASSASSAAAAAGAGAAGTAGAAGAAGAAAPATVSVPSKMLLVRGLEAAAAAAAATAAGEGAEGGAAGGGAGGGGGGGEALKASLRQLFGAFHGLVDVRVVESRGLAFVEFVSEAAATPALQALHNFKMSAATTLTVSYAR